MIQFRKYLVVVLFVILMAYALTAMIPVIIFAALIHYIDPKVDGQKFDFKASIDKAIAKVEAKAEELKKASK
ncbi:conserved hypothetical predicted membrane protein [Edwardsiella phage PEi26]|uniref:Conserved hypothetical predicted membrane protein n=1 Tax=Edwardsiella phage PEi26 TaxID=1608311 RepID=A0A0B6VP72_9CAUD|nr:conserved hypothetical predicted membrane protein [Edwardsiella phage PEi26]